MQIVWKLHLVLVLYKVKQFSHIKGRYKAIQRIITRLPPLYSLVTRLGYKASFNFQTT
jgi:hypothetical protein